jgi:hypothetical protein
VRFGGSHGDEQLRALRDDAGEPANPTPLG